MLCVVCGCVYICACTILLIFPYTCMLQGQIQTSEKGGSTLEHGNCRATKYSPSAMFQSTFQE